MGGGGALEMMYGMNTPMVVHVLYLPLDVAVDALAVRAVRKLAHHAQAVGPLLPGEELLDGHNDALTPPLAVHAHHLLPQGHLGGPWRALLRLPPPSLQGSERGEGDASLSVRVSGGL